MNVRYRKRLKNISTIKKHIIQKMMERLGISVNRFRNIIYKKERLISLFFYRIKIIINLYIIIMRIGK